MQADVVHSRHITIEGSDRYIQSVHIYLRYHYLYGLDSSEYK